MPESPIGREGIFLCKKSIQIQYIVVIYSLKNTVTVIAVLCNYFVRICVLELYSDLEHT